jgi:hypothetical protein
MLRRLCALQLDLRQEIPTKQIAKVSGYKAR